MTRDEIVAEAARRLGDTSTGFLAEVDAAFDFVLGDLAAHEAISPLRRLANMTVTTGRYYQTDTALGLGANVFPYEIFTLRVWAWSPDSLIPRAGSDEEFEQLRAAEGEDITGRFRLWRLYPNNRVIQVHPPGGAEEAGATCEVLYVAPPSIITGATELTEVQYEDLETIVYGLQARAATMKEETAGDMQIAEALYVAGRQRMWGRRKNRRVRQIRPVDLP